MTGSIIARHAACAGGKSTPFAARRRAGSTSRVQGRRPCSSWSAASPAGSPGNAAGGDADGVVDDRVSEHDVELEQLRVPRLCSRGPGPRRSSRGCARDRSARRSRCRGPRRAGRSSRSRRRTRRAMRQRRRRRPSPRPRGSRADLDRGRVPRCYRRLHRMNRDDFGAVPSPTRARFLVTLAVGRRLVASGPEPDLAVGGRTGGPQRRLLPFSETAVSAVRRCFPAARLDCGVT